MFKIRLIFYVITWQVYECFFKYELRGCEPGLINLMEVSASSPFVHGAHVQDYNRRYSPPLTCFLSYIFPIGLKTRLLAIC